MKSIQDLLDPELRGLLGEIALQPRSLLFGRSNPKPTLWTGRERGLSGAEKELLRAHREALGFYVRLNSGYLQIDLDRNVGRFGEEQKRRHIENLGAVGTDPLDAWAFALRATSGASAGNRQLQTILAGQPPKTSTQVIGLLREMQRLDPHVYTAQHLASWFVWMNNPQAAMASIAGWEHAAILKANKAKLFRTIGDAQHALDNFGDAASWYIRSHQEEPDMEAFLLAILNVAISDDHRAISSVRALMREYPVTSEAVSSFRRLIAMVDGGRSRAAMKEVNRAKFHDSDDLFAIAQELVTPL